MQLLNPYLHFNGQCEELSLFTPKSSAARSSP